MLSRDLRQRRLVSSFDSKDEFMEGGVQRIV